MALVEVWSESWGTYSQRLLLDLLWLGSFLICTITLDKICQTIKCKCDLYIWGFTVCIYLLVLSQHLFVPSDSYFPVLCFYDVVFSHQKKSCERKKEKKSKQYLNAITLLGCTNAPRNMQSCNLFVVLNYIFDVPALVFLASCMPACNYSWLIFPLTKASISIGGLVNESKSLSNLEQIYVSRPSMAERALWRNTFRERQRQLSLSKPTILTNSWFKRYACVTLMNIAPVIMFSRRAQ